MAGLQNGHKQNGLKRFYEFSYVFTVAWGERNIQKTLSTGLGLGVIKHLPSV